MRVVSRCTASASAISFDASAVTARPSTQSHVLRTYRFYSMSTPERPIPSLEDNENVSASGQRDRSVAENESARDLDPGTRPLSNRASKAFVIGAFVFIFGLGTIGSILLVDVAETALDQEPVAPDSVEAASPNPGGGGQGGDDPTPDASSAQSAAEAASGAGGKAN